jgi:predicted ATPase
MKFITSNSDKQLNEEHVYLYADSWDDWFEFSTLYRVTYFDSANNRHLIGATKIGEKGMKGQRRPNIPDEFEELDDIFFSVGQDVSFYERLNDFDESIRDAILTGLNDIALNQETYDAVIEERVTKVSLLRSVTPSSIKGQYRRLARGIAELSRYNFKYTAPKIRGSDSVPLELTFNVEPNSTPPTNIHVLIGRNGVGKTHLLDGMMNSLLNEKAQKYGNFYSEDYKQIFSSVISVTFSAFDTTEPLPEQKDKTKGLLFHYIGLKRIKKGSEINQAPKSPTILKNEFVKSVNACRKGAKHERWKAALSELESDIIFKESEVSRLADYKNDDDFKVNAGELFNKFSSGHKIVLLTITRLIETIEERSLVLLDEPEAHLHPPLLSAFVRALSNLLIQRNAVAIIATHSPVVLQEVPRSCVWKLRRVGRSASIERLETESFGENVGLLTREVFGLEVTYSGFHKMILNEVFTKDTYEEVVSAFGTQIGFEAKAIIRAMINNKSNN